MGGVCCSCGYAGLEETECPKRRDMTHCVHWWDGPGGIQQTINSDGEAAMEQVIGQTHDLDENGNPDGGVTNGRGLDIRWQKGPLGTGADRKEANGAFVEDVINAAIGRLEFYQSSKFACDENAQALNHLHRAMVCLRQRTANRQVRGVEGTHAV